MYGADISLHLSIAIKYIDGDITLRNLLCLNKSIHHKIRGLVFK